MGNIFFFFAQNMRFSPWWKFRLWSSWLYCWLAW